MRDKLDRILLRLGHMNNSEPALDDSCSQCGNDPGTCTCGDYDGDTTGWDEVDDLESVADAGEVW